MVACAATVMMQGSDRNASDGSQRIGLFSHYLLTNLSVTCNCSRYFMAVLQEALSRAFLVHKRETGGLRREFVHAGGGRAS